MNVVFAVLSVLGVILLSVLGLVLLLLLVLLPMRVRAVVRYDKSEGFRLNAGLGPFMLKLFPGKGKKKAAKKNKKAKEKSDEASGDESSPTPAKDGGEKTEESSRKGKKGLRTYIKALGLTDYLHILEKANKHLLSKMYFQKLHLNVSVASSDAMKTATLYGKISVAVFPILGYLDSKKKINDGEVHIRPDFTAEKTDAVLDGEACFRLFRAVHAGIIILIYIYKIGRRNNNG